MASTSSALESPILSRLSQNDPSLKFLLVGTTPEFDNSKSFLGSFFFPDPVSLFLSGSLSKTQFHQKLKSLYEVDQPVFIDELQIDQLFDSLSANTQLQHLVIAQEFFSDAQIKQLTTWLSSNPGLLNLYLIVSSLSDAGCREIAQSLRTNSTLTSLTLSGPITANEGLLAIDESIRNNASLTSLAIMFKSIPKEGLIAIGESLRTNSTLTSLALWSDTMENAGLIAIGESLRINSPIISLILKSNSMEKEGLISIGESLRTNSTLTFLTLTSDSMEKEGLITICETLRTNPSLASFTLGSDLIEKEALIAVGESLRTNSTLSSLSLLTNSIEKQQLITIGQSLQTNSSLASLSLGCQSLEKDGLIAIGESLRTNSTLTSLFLLGDSISKEGLIVIGDSLNTNITLPSIDFHSFNSSSLLLPDNLLSHLNPRRKLKEQLASFFPNEIPSFDSFSTLSIANEYLTLKELFSRFSKHSFMHLCAELINNRSMNAIQSQSNPRNDLIHELEVLLSTKPLNAHAILTRLQEMSGSADELYRVSLSSPSPLPSSSSSIPQSPSSSSTLNTSPQLHQLESQRHALFQLIQGMLDRYPLIMNKLEQFESSLTALGLDQSSQRVMNLLSEIPETAAEQNMAIEGFTLVNRSISQSLKKVQLRIQKTRNAKQFLESLLQGIPQAISLVESKIRATQEERDSLEASRQAEVTQLRNVVSQCVQSLSALYRRQTSLIENKIQSLQSDLVEFTDLGMDITKITKDIARNQTQLQVPQGLLEQLDQLAAILGVTTKPPVMTIEELKRVSPQFELDHRHIEIGEKIGEGGMADVHRGKFYATPVAIKKLLRCEDFASIQKEVKNWSQLHHPHLLAFIGYSNQSSLIVMELMDKSLADILYLKSTLLGRPPTIDEPPLLKITFDQCFDMIFAIASGLCYLHSRDMVHRDIKSLNVLVRGFAEGKPDFDIKIADFGATRSLASLAKTTLLNKTPRWSAPELYQPGAKTTTQSDIFAYAMVVYEIMVRKLPFSTLTTELELAKAHLKRQRPNIELEHFNKIHPDKVKALVGIIEDGWQEDPLSRPSADIILQKLTDIRKIPTSPQRYYGDDWDQDFSTAFPPASSQNTN